jgi:hypothetical protein
MDEIGGALGYVREWEEIRTVFLFCEGNLKDKDNLERGLERKIMWILKDAGRDVVYWIKLAQHRGHVVGCCGRGYEPSLFTKL